MVRLVVVMSGIRLMASSQPGRAAIAEAIDVFYDIGWYELVPQLAGSFAAERNLFAGPSGAFTSLATNCQKGN